jgi:hypothetical protein
MHSKTIFKILKFPTLKHIYFPKLLKVILINRAASLTLFESQSVVSSLR